VSIAGYLAADPGFRVETAVMRLTDRLLKALMYRTSSRVKAKHLYAFLRYNSPAKLWNLGRVTAGTALRRTSRFGYPYVIAVEPTNVCNVECPACPTGRGEANGRKTRTMNLANFRKVIDEIGRYVYVANLQNWGEPLLAKDVAGMIAYCHDKRIYTSVETNGNYPEALNERLIDAHLDQITFAMDGSTQEIYGAYRIGGRLELLLTNLRTLLRLKAERDVAHPFVEIQFLVFQHNRDDLSRIREMAQELGVDGLLVRAGNAPNNQAIVKEFYTWPTGRKRFCDLPWRAAVVNSDGGVVPCCRHFQRKDDYGNMFEEEGGFEAIWNGPAFRKSRAAIAATRLPDLHPVCSTCHVFRSAH
jgi:pyruvate-formate lyase-activating enzyme